MDVWKHEIKILVPVFLEKEKKKTLTEIGVRRFGIHNKSL